MKRLFLGVMISFLAFTEQAFAVSLYTEPAVGTLRIGDTKIIPIRLAVEKDECINVADVVLEYSENINPIDISIGKSILSIWVEKPTINRDLRQITFAGGIPNGYCGRTEGDPSLTNILAEVIFRSTETSISTNVDSLKSNEAWVNFSDLSLVYLNNGSGEKIYPRLIGSDLTITNNEDGLISDYWQTEIKNDTISPEDFTIDLKESPNGKYWITFNTSDKQTGVSHYEILEETLSEFKNFNWGRTGASWVTSDSPYYLKDQSLNSTIWVKAVDKAGNEKVATLVPRNNVEYKDLVGFDYSFFGIITNPIILIILIILVALGVWFGVLQVRRKAKEKTGRGEEGEEKKPLIYPCLTTKTRLEEIRNMEEGEGKEGGENEKENNSEQKLDNQSQ